MQKACGMPFWSISIFGLPEFCPSMAPLAAIKESLVWSATQRSCRRQLAVFNDSLIICTYFLAKIENKLWNRFLRVGIGVLHTPDIFIPSIFADHFHFISGHMPFASQLLSKLTHLVVGRVLTELAKELVCRPEDSW